MDFNLENFLPYKLSLVSNTVSHALAKNYAKHGISRTQWRILAVLGGGKEMTAGVISQKTLMDKTTISRAASQLISKKFVRRRASQSDGRASPMVLTAKGQKLFETIVPIAVDGEQQLRAKLTNAECAALEKILGRILEEN